MRYDFNSLVGAIPENLVLDHFMCDQRSCVSPWHLKPVTDQQNTLRSTTTIAYKYASRTHCSKGHPLSGDNVKIYPHMRICLTCRNERAKRWIQANRHKAVEYSTRHKNRKLLMTGAKTLIHSFSSLNQYENCPYRYAEQYLYKTIKWEGNKGTWKGDAAHEALEKRVGQRKALPKELVQYEPFASPFDQLPDTVHLKVEQRYGISTTGQACDFFANDVYLRGKIDVAVVSPDFTKAVVTDWKTNKTIWDKPFELEVSALYLKAAHPSLQVVLGNYVWLTHNKLGKQHDLSDFNSTWNRVLTLHAQIEADAKAKAFEKKPGPLCKWCPVKACEHNRSRENES